MTSQIHVNPQFIDSADRSAQYGDASFTSMYVENGRVVLFEAHIQRLQNACERLKIGFADWDALVTKVTQTATDVCSKQCPFHVIKIIISRGAGGRGYQVPEQERPVCIITTHATSNIRTFNNIEQVNISAITLPEHDTLGGLKHNNRLAQVTAKQELSVLGCDDLLLCDARQQVIEATSSNIFYRLGGAWFTPSLANVGVRGLMRDALMSYLNTQSQVERKFSINVASHHASQFKYIDALLLTNAVKGVVPVSSLYIDNKKVNLDTQLQDIINPFLDTLLEHA
ncbi:aminodeoxychorismate lyase [Ningiella sp. W23]|uniref:aminodeoxychorismate lyase n=1 Tax=Ningiella sp. W23 TaxID=3023715 RepID=UPI0037576CC7